MCVTTGRFFDRRLILTEQRFCMLFMFSFELLVCLAQLVASYVVHIERDFGRFATEHGCCSPELYVNNVSRAPRIYAVDVCTVR